MIWIQYNSAFQSKTMSRSSFVDPLDEFYSSLIAVLLGSVPHGFLSSCRDPRRILSVTNSVQSSYVDWRTSMYIRV